MSSLAPATTDRSLDSLPAEIEAIIRAWRTYLALFDRQKAEVDELRAVEIAERCLPADVTYGLVLNPYSFEDNRAEVAGNALGAIIACASRLLSPPGVRVDIRENEVKDSCPAAVYSECGSTFDPGEVWVYLSRRFSRGAGARTEYAKTADLLKREFGLSQGMEPKVVSGRHVFEVRAFRNSLESALSSHAAESLHRVLYGIATVGVWSGNWGGHEASDISGVRAMISEACRYKGDPPIRCSITDIALIVPRKERWDFRLSEKFAEQMQIFIREFETDSEER